jgi:hypothetical protein
MKKVSLCIVTFLVLFLMLGAYTAWAATYFDIPVFEALNGKWIKITWTIKGTDAEAYGDVPEKFSEKHTAWGCVYWDPTYDWDLYGDDDTPGFIDIGIYDESVQYIGAGFMWLSTGTVDNWSGRDRKSTRLNSSHSRASSFPASALKKKNGGGGGG